MRALHLAVAGLLAAVVLPADAQTASAHGPHGLERPAAHATLLRDAARDGSVIVALFSLPGCPYCEAIRREQLRHLAREQAAQRLRVVEYDLTDRTPFAGTPAHAPGAAQPASGAADASGAVLPRSAAALAASLDVRVAPTVAFLGPDGKEIAERLVGYSSPEFYGAYLDQRIAQARTRLGAR